MNDRDKAKRWMEKNRQSCLDECEDETDARAYLVADCNSESGTDLPVEVLEELAKEVIP